MLAAGSGSYLWLLIHGTFLQHAGEFENAVADWKKVEQLSLRSGIPDRATALNGLAYSQALAKVELDEALTSVNEALDLEEGNYNILDTRGYIHFLRKDYEAALADLDLAVPGCDKAVELADANARVNSTPPLFHKVVSARPKRLLEIAPPDAQSRRISIGTAAAVVHYHRSLVLNALDRKDDAKKDWEIARQLIGREPDETLF
jgi:tetratricopeptide (TPR) repeat protein